MRPAGLLLVALASCAAPPAAPRTPAPRYPQLEGFFPLGMYLAADRMADGWDREHPTRIGRPVFEVYVRCLEDMARRHINLVAIEGTSSLSVPHLKRLIREGEARGILTWASENGLPPDGGLEAWVAERHSQFRGERGLLAWSPWDEPYPEHMERWLRIKKLIEAADPDHPVIAMTCGGPKGFERHSVAQGFDYYPVMADRPDPWHVGPMVRWYVNAAGAVPVWFAQQAFHGEGRRMPTPAEGRLMTHLAIANGSKGILHFIYDHLTDHVQTPTGPLWNDIGLMNFRLTAIGPELLGTMPVETPASLRLHWVPNVDPHRAPAMASAGIGVLQGGGRTIVLVYNTSTREPVRARLESSGAPLWDLQPLIELGRDPAATRDLSMEIAPGDGRFFWLGDDADDVAARIRVNAARRRVPPPERDAPTRAALDQVQGELAAFRARVKDKNRYWRHASAYLELEAAYAKGETRFADRILAVRKAIADADPGK